MKTQVEIIKEILNKPQKPDYKKKKDWLTAKKEKLERIKKAKIKKDQAVVSRRATNRGAGQARTTARSLCP